MDDAPKLRTNLDSSDKSIDSKPTQEKLSKDSSPVGKETAALKDPYNTSQQTVDKHFTSANDLLSNFNNESKPSISNFNNESKQTTFRDGATQDMRTAVGKNSVEFNASTRLPDGRTNDYNGVFSADGRYSSTSTTHEKSGAESVYKVGPNGESSIQSHNAGNTVNSRTEFAPDGSQTYREKSTELAGIRTTQAESPTSASITTDRLNPNSITRLNETTIDKASLEVKSVAFQK
jgi:hypothetical protein